MTREDRHRRSPLVGRRVAATAAVRGRRSRAAKPCPVFPADNPWNRRVDTLPVARGLRQRPSPRSGATKTMHADFGSGLWDGGPIGIPVTVVGKAQREEPRRASSTPTSPTAARTRSPRACGSRAARAPTATATRSSSTATPAGSTSSTRSAASAARWTAGSGAIWDLRSNRLRPAGWTSADAAGLPILPGLARYDEVASGRIDHALRFTVSRTRRAYVWPARHYASIAHRPGAAADGRCACG